MSKSFYQPQISLVLDMIGFGLFQHVRANVNDGSLKFF